MMQRQELTVLLLFINVTVSLGVWQHITVLEGRTLTLKCPIKNAHKSKVEWKNPNGFVMFFNHNKALKDKRYSIEKLSASEFTISVSNITFKDGGNYTCFDYGKTIERTVEVTVLGYPKIAVTRLDGKRVIKCSAAANHHIPQIYWMLDNKIEIAAQTHSTVEYGIRKYTSEDTLHIKSVEKRITVTCIVRHPALHSKLLSNFVNIGQAFPNFPRTIATTSPMTHPQRPTDSPRITSQWTRIEGTAELQTTDLFESSTVGSSGPETITYTTGIHLSTIYNTESSPPDSTSTNNDTSTVTNVTTTTENSESSPPDSTFTNNDTTVTNVTTITGQTQDDVTTRSMLDHNGTSSNITNESFDGLAKQKENGSSVLVFLVTCLIFSLLVVVIFFVIKLRRAHILWKRENEESDQSTDSSKSKSSQEEKQVQEQKRRGLFSNVFATYVIQEPREIEESAAESIQRDSPPITPQTDGSANVHIKETEL